MTALLAKLTTRAPYCLHLFAQMSLWLGRIWMMLSYFCSLSSSTSLCKISWRSLVRLGCKSLSDHPGTYLAECTRPCVTSDYESFPEARPHSKWMSGSALRCRNRQSQTACFFAQYPFLGDRQSRFGFRLSFPDSCFLFSGSCCPSFTFF